MKAKNLFAGLALVLALTSCGSNPTDTKEENKEEVKTEETSKAKDVSKV